MSSVVVIDNGCSVETLGDVEAQLWNKRTGVLELYTTPTHRVSVDTHKNKVIFKEGNTCGGVFFKGVAEVCTYPECNCPFDMGADNKCLRGFCNAK